MTAPFQSRGPQLPLPSVSLSGFWHLPLSPSPRRPQKSTQTFGCRYHVAFTPSLLSWSGPTCPHLPPTALLEKLGFLGRRAAHHACASAGPQCCLVSSKTSHPWRQSGIDSRSTCPPTLCLTLSPGQSPRDGKVLVTGARLPGPPVTWNLPSIRPHP